MSKKFEDVVKYNVYEAIEIKSEKNMPLEERMQTFKNNPARIPNNPLLLDYNWVYEHVEEIFVQDIFYYQNYQSTEAYYIFFKAITAKYRVEEDYNEYLRTGETRLITIKWRLFGYKLIDFISDSFDERIKELLKKEDVINYFLRYPLLYDWDLLKKFCHLGLEVLLEKEEIAKYCINDYTKLIRLIENNPKIQIPITLMQNEKIICEMVRTPRLEEFAFNMDFILEQCSGQAYYEGHKEYCDEEVANIKNGILPCYQKEYEQAPDVINKEVIANRSHYLYYNYMQNQVFTRILEQFNTESISKGILYKEFSKYMIIGMFISSHFETGPYNLMVDIETLYEFGRQNNRELRGKCIYDFLINFETKSIKEIIAFYQEFQNVPLKEMLYDDWKEQEELFVLDLNAKILNPLTLAPVIREDGIVYYDISDVSKLLLVHETSVSESDAKGLEKMLEQIKTGSKERICLSVHDQEHSSYYDEERKEGERTIKFLYGPLAPNRVGIVYHKDAYSMGINSVEVALGNLDYKRRLYTTNSLMEETSDYNEINYMIDKTPFLPIGIICEDEITEVEVMVARFLNISLLYQKTKENIKRPYKKEKIKKHYQYRADKPLF